jgi:hypothetical protein
LISTAARRRCSPPYAKSKPAFTKTIIVNSSPQINTTMAAAPVHNLQSNTKSQNPRTRARRRHKFHDATKPHLCQCRAVTPPCSLPRRDSLCRRIGSVTDSEAVASVVEVQSSPSLAAPHHGTELPSHLSFFPRRSAPRCSKLLPQTAVAVSPQLIIKPLPPTDKLATSSPASMPCLDLSKFLFREEMNKKKS